MKKLIFAIFAHPDDEAFGPSGTLLLEARAGSEVHLIGLTDGAAGMNPDNLPNLGSVRLTEWRKAGELLGAASQHHLGFRDGCLCNKDMIAASEQIVQLVKDVSAKHPDRHEIEFMTNDLNGITGHIDHIVAARAACHAFYTLKGAGLPLTRIRLTCIPHAYMPTVNTDWLFMEAGRRDDEIDETIDARALKNDILAIMQAHHTQRSDYEAHLKRRGEHIGLNYFIVKT